MDIATGIFEGIHNKFLFHPGDSFVKAEAAARGAGAAALRALQGAGQVMGAQHGIFADEHGAFHDVFQLTHVAGPVVLQQKVDGRRGNAPYRAVVFLAEHAQKMLREGQNVLRPFAQRRNEHGKDIDAVVQILAE